MLALSGFLNASLCRTLIPIRTRSTVGVYMPLNVIEFGKNSEMGSLMPFLSTAFLMQTLRRFL